MVLNFQLLALSPDNTAWDTNVTVTQSVERVDVIEGTTKMTYLLSSCTLSLKFKYEI